ncbi:MAG: cytochrome c oxidase assembly protein [Acidimicrobiales bacterium]
MNYIAANWSYDPFLLIVVGIVAVHEIGLAHLARRSRPERTRVRRRRSVLFYGGLAMLLLAVESPIDYWANDYFFVHMIQHIMLMFYAPPLIIAGAPWTPLLHALPVDTRRRVLRAVLLDRWSRPLRRVGRIISYRWTGVIAFNVAMLGWHVPALLDLAQRNQAVHIWLMHGSFFVTGVLFWAQIIPSPPVRQRLTYIQQAGTIIASSVTMWFLAMALSIFSTASWYVVYAHIPGVTLSPFSDQQIGAAILWVCGDTWAFPALVYVFRRAAVGSGGADAFADQLLHARAHADRFSLSGGRSSLGRRRRHPATSAPVRSVPSQRRGSPPQPKGPIRPAEPGSEDQRRAGRTEGADAGWFSGEQSL